ncbi:hypothetical protein EYF80_063966 [Liparis tanakae]|uniref:Uncharacterized protein n=1 Tax=Liparis tanakae TaxID=230148 RepID=A0A4Z2EAQ5_9TELE|nr:hypothetical protein EYF80_063966 [Liparis tanakae]
MTNGQRLLTLDSPLGLGDMSWFKWSEGLGSSSSVLSRLDPDGLIESLITQATLTLEETLTQKATSPSLKASWHQNLNSKDSLRLDHDIPARDSCLLSVLVSCWSKVLCLETQRPPGGPPVQPNRLGK